VPGMLRLSALRVVVVRRALLWISVTICHLIRRRGDIGGATAPENERRPSSDTGRPGSGLAYVWMYVRGSKSRNRILLRWHMGLAQRMSRASTQIAECARGEPHDQEVRPDGRAMDMLIILAPGKE
jgi:hypothetical protein